jgi:integrase/recombinase XerD
LIGWLRRCAIPGCGLERGQLKPGNSFPFLYMQNLSKSELLALLKAAKDESERDWLMILVCYWHGFRSTEVTQFTRDAIADGYITMQRLKGSLKTIQPLMEHPEPLLNERAALEKFIAPLHPNQRVFGISRVHFWRLIQKYAKAAGVPKHKAHPHALKHSIAMHLVEKIPINALQRWVGHASLASTGEYTKVNDEQASAAVERVIRSGPVD